MRRRPPAGKNRGPVRFCLADFPGGTCTGGYPSKDPSPKALPAPLVPSPFDIIPRHSIVRIDEVEKQGLSKIRKLEGGNVAQFPVPIYSPGGESKS